MRLCDEIYLQYYNQNYYSELKDRALALQESVDIRKHVQLSRAVNR